MKTWKVLVTQRYYITKEVTVKAENESNAVDKALEIDIDFNIKDLEYEENEAYLLGVVGKNKA